MYLRSSTCQGKQQRLPDCLGACPAACHAAGDEAKGCGLFAAVDLVTHLQIAKIYTRSLQTHAYAHRAKHTKGRGVGKGRLLQLLMLTNLFVGAQH